MLDFRLLNEQLNVYEVARALDLHQFHGQSAYWRGECPFHQSTSRKPRSLKIDPGSRKWYCHKCHRGGDLIDLWAGVRGISLIAAAAQMSVEFRIHAEQRRGTVVLCPCCRGRGVVQVTNPTARHPTIAAQWRAGEGREVLKEDGSIVWEFPCPRCGCNTEAK